jgi:hypothetical protein
MSRLADLLDRFIDWFAPLPPEFQGAEWLADVEEDLDSFDPADMWPDLPAADCPIPPGVSGGGTTRTPLRVVPPADATAASATAPGVGGHQLSERDYINALVEDYRVFITECFRTRGR